MTNSYDVDHGLSQCPPGPLEPVEIAQLGDTLARTGNTARDQEMYAAGIRTGEENAKHNAAIRAATGWLPIESAPKDGTEILAWREDCGQFIASYTSADAFPLTQAELDAYDEATLFAKDWFTQWPDATRLDGSEVPTLWQPLPADPCPTCNDQGAVGNILTAEPCPDCAAPGVSTVEDAGAQKEAVMDAIADALGEAYDCTRVWHAWSYGTMGPDDFALVAADPSRVAEIATAAIAAMRPAPAAGDALDAVDVDWQLLRETSMLVRDRFSAALSIAYASSDATRSAIRRAHETHEALLAMLDAAIAAQRKGDA